MQTKLMGYGFVFKVNVYIYTQLITQNFLQHSRVNSGGFVHVYVMGCCLLQVPQRSQETGSMTNLHTQDKQLTTASEYTLPAHISWSVVHSVISELSPFVSSKPKQWNHRAISPCPQWHLRSSFVVQNVTSELPPLVSSRPSDYISELKVFLYNT